MKRALLFHAAAFVLLCPATLPATDGVIEINQARALAGGVTPGDGAGFPVTLGKPGSYRLTSNLDTSGIANSQNIDVIDVTADNVTIDLNGFSIFGPVACTGGPPVTTCSPTGTGIGISDGMHVGTVVLNGTVRGMGSSGIQLYANSRVEGVRAESNGYVGIYLLQKGIATHCHATSNGGAGMFGNTATFSLDDASFNKGNGIATGFGSVIVNNTVYGNAGVGLALSAGTNADAYGGNVILSNGSTVAGGVQIGVNVCNGTTTCP